MQRREREIKDRSEIDSIIRLCPICRLGLSNGKDPYVVPLCFGYDGQALYFHGAGKGKKMDFLRRNNRVCFEFDIFEGVVEDDRACYWGMCYHSVIGFGSASFIKDLEEKRQALSLLMRQYSSKTFDLPDDALSRTLVIKVEILAISGKHGRLA